MKKQSLILLTLLMVISCSKPNVQKDVKIVEQEAKPVVEEPKVVKQAAKPVVEEPKVVKQAAKPVVEEPKVVKQTAKPVVQVKKEIPKNLKGKWGERIEKQQEKDKLQQEKEIKTEILEQEIETCYGKRN